MINSQRAYGSFTAWWLARADAPDFPPQVPDGVAPDFPDDEAEGQGSLDDIRARLDAIVDLAAGRLGGLDDEALAARARWSGFAVDVGFRLGRWSSHMREHTVQVDKTLAMLGRAPTEVERLVRLVNGAYGRLEAVVFALPPAVVESSGRRRGGRARRRGARVARGRGRRRSELNFRPVQVTDHSANRPSQKRLVRCARCKEPTNPGSKRPPTGPSGRLCASHANASARGVTRSTAPRARRAPLRTPRRS